MRSAKYGFCVEEIERGFHTLGEEETASGQVCPACEGGASQEKSLSVTRRDGVLWWNCHRDSCGFKGRTRVYGADANQNPGTKKSRVRAYVPTTKLSPATLRFLATKYRLPRSSLELAELSWTGDQSTRDGRRVCYPIFGPDTKKRGENYRSYEDGVTPKAIIHLGKEDAIASAWYKFTRTSKCLVLVEDQVSAIKLAPYTHALALLGTNLSEAKASEIGDEYERIYLCFDNDAIGTAIKTQIEWSSRFPNMGILGIMKDIKDMDDNEFDIFLKRIK